MSGLVERGKGKQNLSLKKSLIIILAIIIFSPLLSEIILGLAMGYDLGGRAIFEGGAVIEGNIEYNTNNLDIGRGRWEVNYYNLSTVTIKLRDEEEHTFATSNVTIRSVASADNNSRIDLFELTSVSNFAIGANLRSDISTIYWNYSSEDKITGTMAGNTSYLDYSNVIFIMENDLLNASNNLSLNGEYILHGETDDIQFDVSLDENCTLSSKIDPPKYNDLGEVFHIKGKVKVYDFDGSIWSNGKLYTKNADRTLYSEESGYINLKIVHYGGEHRSYRYMPYWYQWEFEIEGKDVVVEGSGYPFWIVGLILSAIPSVIIVVYHIHKKILNDKKKIKN